MIHFLSDVKTAVYFLAVLSVLVIAHEWGHFIVAKLFRMRVEDFSLFFGKRLFRLGVRNGTEYNVRAVPLGGFVKIAGMEPDDASNGSPVLGASAGLPQARTASGKRLSGLTEDAIAEIDPDDVSNRVRQAVLDSIGPDQKLTAGGKDEILALLSSTGPNETEHRYMELVLAADSYAVDPRSFNQKPLYQRALVIFAGPFMSVLFGYALFCVLGFTTGLPSPDSILPVVVSVESGTPAARAGMQAGDRIIAIDGTHIRTGDQMVAIIHHSIGRRLVVTVMRHGTAVTFAATPFASTDTVPLDDGRTVQRVQGHLGFTPQPDTRLHRYTPADSIRRGTVLICNGIITMVQKVFSRQVSENVGGPIMIASQIHEAQQGGPVYVLIIAASLSISLGIVNLFPIPVLDGGHLLLLGVEFLRQRKLSTREIQTAQIVGISVIGVLFVLVMYNDIIHLIPHGRP